MPRPPLPPSDDGFQVRGASPSRLEAFSDAVFAFAITLLVVSLDVPRTFDELLAMMSGFVGFGFSFAMLVMLWQTHARFFRRFGLQDRGTLWLNSVLLFLILFFVYPLKFVFTLTASLVVGTDALGGVSPFRAGQGLQMMALYGAGFMAVFAVFAGMYANALRQRDALGLTPEEVGRTRTEIEGFGIVTAVAALSVALAAVPGVTPTVSGFVYFLIGPALGAHGYLVGRRRVLRARALAETERGAEEPAEVAA